MELEDKKSDIVEYIEISGPDDIEDCSNEIEFVTPLLAVSDSFWDYRESRLKKLSRKIKKIYCRCFPKYECDWKHTEQEYQEIEKNGYYQIIVSQEFIPASSIKIDKSGFEFPWHGHSYADFERLCARYEKCIQKYSIDGGRKSAIGIKRWFPDVYEAFFDKPICLDVETGNIGDGRHRVYVLAKHNLSIPVWKTIDKFGKDVSLDEFLNNDTIGGWRF